MVLSLSTYFVISFGLALTSPVNMVRESYANADIIRVHVHFIDEFKAEIKNIIKETVLVISRIVTLKKRLRPVFNFVRGGGKPADSPRETFRLGRERNACASVFIDGPNAGRCAKISRNYKGDFCGLVPIPAEHLEGLPIYNFIDTTPQLTESLSEGEGFVDGTNFVVYFTSRERSTCAKLFAHSVMCRIEPKYIGGVISGRPVAGGINMCPEELNNASEMLLKRIVAHEMIHLLGFNYKSILEYIDCEEDQEDVSCWKRGDVIRVVAKSRLVIKVGALYEAALQIRNTTFKCTSVDCNDGSDDITRQAVSQKTDGKRSLFDEYLDSEGIFNSSESINVAETGTGLHWQDHMFPTQASLMSAGGIRSREISFNPLTLALLLTSGWYSIQEKAVYCSICYLNDRTPEICLPIFASQGVANDLKDTKDSLFVTNVTSPTKVVELENIIKRKENASELKEIETRHNWCQVEGIDKFTPSCIQTNFTTSGSSRFVWQSTISYLAPVFILMLDCFGHNGILFLHRLCQ
ncbi:leishmanolysin-like peptidase isoform X1 [Palaemon carinicauda]|uniref:leishmanolysin-like peptidase isoform X1 n=1 Tax=Palaemon carinicauda TaxID=392227 RepID=UPI0035B639C0